MTGPADHWIPVGLPGFSGDDKQRRHDLLSERFGADGWRWGFVVRGAIVGFDAAIAEYEQSYRVHLARHPEVVEWLMRECGNVYDHDVANVYDDDYEQTGPAANHYQDISVRRVVGEHAADDPSWGRPADLVDLTTGETHTVPRARGFSGQHLAQIRDADSPAYFLNPALVPVHDPALITTAPGRREWYHDEGCGHLSVEAFWQQCKVVEVRWDRFRSLGPSRHDPLGGL